MESTLRTCATCGLDRPDAEFPSRGRRCLDCRRAYGRAHYRANRSYYLAKARTRQGTVVRDTRAWLLAYLAEHPCVDCGVDDPRVLEFDHRDGTAKVSAVAVLARSGYPLARVAAEVAKCDVRCANCHRIRTRSWWGAEVDPERSRWASRRLAGSARRDSNPEQS